MPYKMSSKEGRGRRGRKKKNLQSPKVYGVEEPNSANEITKDGIVDTSDENVFIQPESSIVLKGKLWKDIMAGILVLNVCWGDKIYGGTLLDLNHFGWTSPDSFKEVMNQLEEGAKDTPPDRSSARDGVAKRKKPLNHVAVRLCLPRTNVLAPIGSDDGEMLYKRRIFKFAYSDERCSAESANPDDCLTGENADELKKSSASEVRAPSVAYCTNCRSAVQLAYLSQSQDDAMPSPKIHEQNRKRATLDDLAAAAALSLQARDNWMQADKVASDMEMLHPSSNDKKTMSNCSVAADERNKDGETERTGSLGPYSRPCGSVMPSSPHHIETSPTNGNVHPCQCRIAPPTRHVQMSATMTSPTEPGTDGSMGMKQVVNERRVRAKRKLSDNFLVDNLTRPQSLPTVDVNTATALWPGSTTNYVAGAYPNTRSPFVGHGSTSPNLAGGHRADFGPYFGRPWPHANYGVANAIGTIHQGTSDASQISYLPGLDGFNRGGVH